MRRLVYAALLLAGCAPAPPGDGPPSKLYGEVHLHGFYGGAHPGALFVAQAVAAAQTEGDLIFPPATTERMGDCALTLSWAPAAPDPATPQVNAGLVQILGGSRLGEVDLTFQPAFRAYLPTETLPSGGIFQGGELLTIRAAGAQAPAFEGTVAAPEVLVLTGPPALAPGAGDLAVTWIPDQAERIDAALVASTDDGRWALVECTAADADGQLAFPAALLAELPAPPRDLQLEVSRDRLAVARGPNDLGVVLHAGYSVQLQAHQE